MYIIIVHSFLGNNINHLSTEKRVQVVATLVDGSSINAVVRMTGVAKHTILKLLEDRVRIPGHHDRFCFNHFAGAIAGFRGCR
jgi:hypothetical protein